MHDAREKYIAKITHIQVKNGTVREHNEREHPSHEGEEKEEFAISEHKRTLKELEFRHNVQLERLDITRLNK